MLDEAGVRDDDERMRLWPFVYAVLGLLPTVLAVRAVVTGSSVPAGLLLGPAAVITVLSLLSLRSSRVLPRAQRGRTLALESWGAVYAFVMAGTFGAALAGWWHGLPWLHANDVFVALVLVVLVFLPGQERLIRVPLLRPLPIMIRALTDKGLFIFLVALAADDTWVARLAAWLVAFSVVPELVTNAAARDPLWRPRRLGARRFLDAPAEEQDKAMDYWVSEYVRGRRVPNLAFVHTLCNEASLAVRGGDPNPELALIQPTPRRPGPAAMAWLDPAKTLLDRASAALDAPESPDAAPTPAVRALDLAWAHWHEAHTEIDLNAGHREEAGTHMRLTRELRVRHGLADLCAFNLADETMNAVQGTSSQTMLPDQALEQVQTMLQLSGLSPAARRVLLIAAGCCHESLGRHAEAEKCRREWRAIRVRRRDLRALVRQDRLAGSLTVSARSHRLMMALYELLDRVVQGMAFDDVYDQGETPMPPLVLASYWPDVPQRALVRQGIQQWMLGNLDGAEKSMLRAVEMLEADNLPIYAMWVLMELGSAQRRIDPAASYANLTRALAIQQDLRTRIQDSDLRLTTGATTERLTRTLTDLLLGADPGPGWPSDRPATVFQLSELSRSRVLLELLGLRSEPADPLSYAELRGLLRTADLDLSGAGER
ncbi:hypothetical protein [Nonomuraea sp. NPDC049400]|uniref:hypothetical protein n=1 Tax=Nonomuraea sp. NPDC049400 TaxID=3364352 RepID=UPI0037AB477C